jgi:hypothetical protein
MLSVGMLCLRRERDLATTQRPTNQGEREAIGMLLGISPTFKDGLGGPRRRGVWKAMATGCLLLCNNIVIQGRSLQQG